MFKNSLEVAPKTIGDDCFSTINYKVDNATRVDLTNLSKINYPDIISIIYLPVKKPQNEGVERLKIFKTEKSIHTTTVLVNA